MTKKYGPPPLAEEERRLSVSVSISNKESGQRLRRFRAAAHAFLGGPPRNAELRALACTLALAAIDAWCESGVPPIP